MYFNLISTDIKLISLPIARDDFTSDTDDWKIKLDFPII